MRVPIALAALLLSSCGVAAASDWSREVTYTENHDVGAIYFSDNTHVHVEYVQIPWETVEAWPQGKALRLEWSLDSGLELVDVAGSQRLRAVLHATDAHPIDVLAEQCMQQPPYADAPCLDEAYQRWGREVTRVYRELLRRTVSKSDRDRLRTAQRSWTAFRDAQVAAIETIIGGRDGKIWPNAARRELNQLLREQQLRLQRMTYPLF